MPWIIAGGALLGGVLSSSAAKDAGQTQANAAAQASANQLQATRESNALTAQMYQQGQYNQAPWLQSGGLGLAALTSGMGLGQIQNPLGGNANGLALNNGRMTAGGPIDRERALGSQGSGSFTNAVGQTVDKNGNPIAAPLLPTQNYGASNADLANAGNAYSGMFTQQFKPGDIYQDSSYQWRLSQGQKALEASAAARGQTGNGQNLRDITDYAQNAASQEYQSQWDRWANRQDTAYNRLAGLAGIGQTTAAGMSTAGQNAAGQIGQNTMAGVGASNNWLTGGAAAQAGGTVGSANAISGGINSGINNWMGMQYLNKFAPTKTQAQPYISSYDNPSAAWGG